MARGRKRKDAGTEMKIEFKKFTIGLTSDQRCFQLNYNDDKYQKNFYYSDFETLLHSILTKRLMKSEAKSVDELCKEVREFKDEIKTLIPFIKKQAAKMYEKIGENM